MAHCVETGERANRLRVFRTEISIYTIGYQGLTIDEFKSILIEKGIESIIDIRNVPLSHKYGFSKFWLIKHIPEFGIEYKSIPELGIPKNYRENLMGNNLWEKYKKIIISKEGYIDNVAQILQEKPTVLMCFEAIPEQCHRFVLSEILSKKTNLKVIHYCQEKREWI